LYGASFNEAIFGSASNVVYFDSATLNYTDNEGNAQDSNVISGTVIAESPALYAFM